MHNTQTVRLGLAAVIVVAAMGAGLGAEPQTLTGQISDNMCGAKHDPGEFQEPVTDAECTKSCVKGGSKYVLVADAKIYTIANQDFADLPTHAGHTVKMSGEVKGETITVSKIEMPAKDEKK